MLSATAPAASAPVAPAVSGDTAANNSQPANKIETVKIKTASEDLIHFGDLIEIDIVGSVEYDWRGRITPEGFMNGLAFDTDQIFALCQSEDDIAQKIAAAYGKYLRSPQITVKIIDRSDRPATTVFGAVKTPHVFRIKRIVKLNELIALSGGIIDTASGEVQILRPARLSCGEDEPVSGKAEAEARYIRVKLADLIAGKPEANPVITTGDIVTVEEAPSIYVIGGVNNPQTILARQEMTVSRAISTAGGALKGADTKKIVIYRRKNGETTTIDVDLSKIEAKQADDVILQALDIVEVPQTGRDSKRPPPEIPVKNRENAQGITGPVVVVD